MTMNVTYLSALLFLLLLGSCIIVEGFQPIASFGGRTTNTLLEARRVKKSSLGTLAEDGIVPTTKRVKKTTSLRQKRANKKATNKKSTKRGGGAAAGGVSADLANWAASAGTQQDEEEAPAPTVMAPVATEFTPFEEEEEEIDTSSKKSGRRVRQNERQKIDKKQEAAIRLITDELEEVLEGKNNIEDILSITKQLMQQKAQEATSLKTLAASQKRLNYRLAWVGGDDALSHVGTGLHKVPLARMQEVFLMLQERSRLEVYEVISVLGPFPNVRNTLQGKTLSVTTNSSPNMWNIEYDSMIDGAGKELLGNQDARKLQLQIYFADKNAIIAVVPPEDGSPRSNPLEDNGANVLVFIREDELDEKLDALRVS